MSFSQKKKGQILIEGIYFLIIFLGFLISVMRLEKIVKEQIQKERLTSENKRGNSRKANRRKPP